MSTTKVKLHGFSRSLANEHCVNEAIIARYLCNRIRQSKNEREGKQWFYNSTRKIAKQFPYFAHSTVAKILNKLVASELFTAGNFNKWKHDKTVWYTAEQATLDAVEENIIYFDPEVATAHGVCAATVIVNIRHRVKEEDEEFISFSPTEYAELSSFSVRAVGRSLNQLVKANLLRRDPHQGGRYGLPTLSQKSQTEAKHSSVETDDQPTALDGKSVDEILALLNS